MGGIIKNKKKYDKVISTLRFWHFYTRHNWLDISFHNTLVTNDMVLFCNKASL